MRDLSKIDIWKRSFGLLPIHLNSVTMEDKFLMLNGGHGDFCLQTNNIEENKNLYFSQAWSTNTKNFVIVDNNEIKIHNWLKDNPEIIPRVQIENNFEKFYSYLLSKSYKTENDVIPFIIDIFRKLRNITKEKDNPLEALNLLFRLLISLEDDYNKINSSKWNIDDCIIPHQFDYFVDLIKQGVNSISPQLDLIVRHSAGALFQEAHKEALYFSPLRDLFGNVSSNILTIKELYTSVHYTPQYLARSIVENSLRLLDLEKDNIKIFDPACGSSEFLIEALKQIKNAGYQGKISVIGWDTSESAISTSKFLLQYEKKTQWDNVKMEYDIRLVHDSLAENWNDDYDLILMNPPFVSWELLKDKQTRDTVLDALGASFKKGKPNQASAFFIKAVQSLNENGVIGCVLPTSILTFDSYSSLRNQVSDYLSISLIGKLGNFVFEDALTDVSFFIGQKPKLSYSPTLLWSKNEKGIVQDALRDLRKMNANNSLTVDEKKYSIYTPTFFPVIPENWKLISLKENNFLKNLSRFKKDGKLTELSNIFTVKQGKRTGNNDVFLFKPAEYMALPSEERYLYRQSLYNESIKDGIISSYNYVWYPYDDSGLIISDELEFIKKAPVSHGKLLLKKDELSSRARIDDSCWWHLSEHRAWLRKKEPRLYSSEFGKSNSFAFDKDGIYVVERGNAWIPKKDFEIEDYYFYLACFSSNLFDQLLSIYSKQLAGGNWYDLGAKYTKNIPIPNIHITEVKESDAYNKLVDLGKELESGNSFVKSVIDEILLSYFYPKM
jgi:hypothetical protein